MIFLHSQLFHYKQSAQGVPIAIGTNYHTQELKALCLEILCLCVDGLSSLTEQEQFSVVAL